MDWHNEFRAYARAFGRDEVAAILLRDDEREWLVWPAQSVEGLTFTLTAASQLDCVPVDDLQHIVGWVHSHPCGMAPSPSNTDDGQIRELAKDLAGNIAEMWIFGGYDYTDYSVTRAVMVEGMTFVSDTELYRKPVEATAWDSEAEAFYAESRPAKSAFSMVPPGWAHHDWMDETINVSGWYDAEPSQCPWCLNDSSSEGALCDSCESEEFEATTMAYIARESRYIGEG